MLSLEKRLEGDHYLVSEAARLVRSFHGSLPYNDEYRMKLSSRDTSTRDRAHLREKLAEHIADIYKTCLYYEEDDLQKKINRIGWFSRLGSINHGLAYIKALPDLLIQNLSWSELAYATAGLSAFVDARDSSVRDRIRSIADSERSLEEKYKLITCSLIEAGIQRLEAKAQKPRNLPHAERIRRNISDIYTNLGYREA
ncbi:hypothetical protein D6745_04905 [Candidatus Woesearchaeota archaeon]|nr:MAG: hypothetical protein D6745_04905 [Candidatus Woesearchaeota archaeon]